MLSTQTLKWLASLIAIVLVAYFVYFHTGLVLVIIAVSFLVVIGVLLLVKKVKKLFGDGDE